MDRVERAGMGLAVAGHVLLFWLLSMAPSRPDEPKPAPPPSMEVAFIADVALDAARPASEPMAQAELPEAGLAASQSAPIAEPRSLASAVELVPAAVPKPAPKSIQVATPKHAAPVKKVAAKTPPAAPALPTRPAPAKPTPAMVANLAPANVRLDDRLARPAAPAKQAVSAAGRTNKAKPKLVQVEPAATVPKGSNKLSPIPAERAVAKRAPASAARAEQASSMRQAGATEKPVRAPRLTRALLAGLSDTPDASPAASATPVMSADAMAGIQAAIKRQVQPCANRQINPGPGANRIGVRLSLRLNKDGSLAAAPQVVATTGVDDENSRYEKRVADLAVATFVGCAPLAGLPDELYRTPKGGWSNFIMNYRLPA